MLDGYHLRGDGKGAKLLIWPARVSTGAAGAAIDDSQIDYEQGTRPWYEQAVEGGLETIRWTPPYEFYTTGEPGITASMGWQVDGEIRVVGIDVLLYYIDSVVKALEAKGYPQGKES